MEEKGETQMTEIAVQIRNSKNQREIGVAVRKPRARSSCVKGQAEEDTKQWSFELYSFTDSKELIDLETLLVQLNPLRCYLPVDLCQDQLVGWYL
jgi:DNA mismatch repair protein MSH2